MSDVVEEMVIRWMTDNDERVGEDVRVI